MAVPQTNGPSSSKEGKKDGQKDKRLVVAAQEIKYAKYLAGNESKTRDRALKTLKKWFQQRCATLPFVEADFMVLWKGLFYSMWMSDKPLVQEECAENISQLIHSLSPDVSMLYFKCGLLTLSNEWFGIDQLRIDKFLMLVRRVIRQAMYSLKHESWKAKIVNEFIEALEKSVLRPDASPLGLVMHVTEIFLEELAKVSEGKIHPNLLLKLIEPFTKQMLICKELRQVTWIRKCIFRYLMKQSDLGLEWNDKFRAWRQLGCPGRGVDSIQKEVISDDEVMSDGDDDATQMEGQLKVLDPRAGRVDVILPQLKFNPKHMVELLNRYKLFPGSNTKTRKITAQLIQEFTDMSNGRFPLGGRKLEVTNKKGSAMKTKQAVNRLIKFENKLSNNGSKKRKSADTVDEGGPKKKKAKIELVPKKLKEKTKKSIAEDVTMKNVERKVMNEKSKKIDVLSIHSFRPKKMNESSISVILDNFETCFSRNSGKWSVYTASPEDSTLNVSAVSLDKTNTLESAINKPDLFNTKPDSSPPTKKRPSPKTAGTPKKIKKTADSNGTFSPENVSTPQKMFPQAEWDKPLNEGEYEFFVPSNKYKSTLKGKSLRHSIATEIPRRRDDFCSEKKVKIDLRLNKSQEIHEHLSTVKRSPAIPFDANKKPSKPLLKPHSVPSPINPFYKRKLLL